MKEISIEFGRESVIDGYEIDGVVYYSKSEVGAFVGMAHNWAVKTIGKSTKAGRYLTEAGYIDDERSVNLSKSGGAVRLKLIRGDQLDLLVSAAALSGSVKAVSLLAASFSEVRVSRERDALGLEPLRMSELKESFDEYRRRWYKWYGSTLTEEEWKAGDKVNPTPEDVEEWAGKVREIYRIQAAQGDQYVIEERDRAVDYDAMMADYS